MLSELFEGEIVHVRSTPVRRRFVHRIGMIGLDLDEWGTAFRGHACWGHGFPRIWSIRRRDHLGAASPLVVPADHVLVVNTEFSARLKSENRAFEVRPRDSFIATVTRVLFSRDLARIGERVNHRQNGCAGNEAS